MWILALLLACGTGDSPIHSQRAEPTKDLKTSALHFPGDSPLAQFVPKGRPAQLTGPLGKLRIGIPEAEARQIADAIASPVRRPEDFHPAPDVIGVAGMLDGFEGIGFVALVQGGVVRSLDVSAPLDLWEGVLETAWGPPASTQLAAGNPGARWENPDANLAVTFANGGGGKATVHWEALDSAKPVP